MISLPLIVILRFALDSCNRISYSSWVITIIYSINRNTHCAECLARYSLAQPDDDTLCMGSRKVNIAKMIWINQLSDC